jgi:hypothetical protein
MATRLPDIFAAGDCVETWHRVLGRATYLPLGTTAHKQGRAAGENAGRLLGAQLLGSSGTEIDKRIDIYATALFDGLPVDAINDLDLSYAPPVGTPWDPVQAGAHARERSVLVGSGA